MPTLEQINDALSTVPDPDLGSDLVSLGMVKDIVLKNDFAKVIIELTTPACPMKDRIRKDCENALQKVEGLKFEVELTARVTSAKTEDVLPQVKNTILVLSGKGGVGKSTVSTNLALCLAQNGAKVGLLDADIYGPSIPTMLGSSENPVLDEEQKILPLQAHGIEVMSSGFLVEEDSALIWRGPMIHKIIQQFCQDVRWGELDYLLLDLPPGTGDVQLSLSQTIPVVGAVLVTTPQQVALADVKRAQSMLNTLKIPLLGVIENMSGYIDQSGEKVAIFGEGGGKSFSEKVDTKFLGEIPIDPAVCSSGDEGTPVVVKHPQKPASKAFFKAAQNLAAQVSTYNHQGIRSRVVKPRM